MDEQLAVIPLFGISKVTKLGECQKRGFTGNGIGAAQFGDKRIRRGTFRSSIRGISCRAVEMQCEKCNSERGLNQEVLILVLASMKNFENPLKPRHIFELSRLTGRSVSQFVMLAMTGVFTA
jgi:hypothetical protein